MGPSTKFAQAIELHRAGQIDQAESIYRKLLKQEPGHHGALNLLGLIDSQKGRSESALRHLRMAVSVAGNVAKYHYDLAVELQTQGEFTAAIESYFKTLECDPNHLQAWENLGVALFDDGQIVEAAEVFQKALSLNPQSLLSLSNLATLLRWSGDHQHALELLERALAYDPLHAELRMKRAELLLSTGRFEEGWCEYAWRFARAGQEGGDAVRHVPLPKWRGESLTGQSLLVHAEQGIGDEVMFASCLTELAELPEYCSVLCDSRLVPVFRRSFPNITFLEWKEAGWGDAGERVAAQFRAPFGDLPQHFRPDIESFAKRSAYLIPDREKAVGWRERLASVGDGLKIGISWRGGKDQHTRRARSIPLAEWEPLLSITGTTFVNLQYGDVRTEIDEAPAAIRQRLITFPEIDPLTELDEFFALLSSLDLVISIDNSTVHFSGALGVPTLLLLPALADWRWPVTGEESLWYESVRLLRQQVSELNDWRPVLDQAVKEVQSRLTEGSGLSSTPTVSRSGLEPKGMKPRSPGERALLINDTSYWYHWGCTCTSLAIRDQLHAKGHEVRGLPTRVVSQLTCLPMTKEQLGDDALFRSFSKRHSDVCRSLEDADLVVINGEGSMHGTHPTALGLLYLAYVARVRLGKPVHLINHSCYPDDTSESTGSDTEALYREVYAALDQEVVIREPASAGLLKKMGLPVRDGFDCLPLFAQRHGDRILREPSERVLLAGSAGLDGAMLEAIVRLIPWMKDQGLVPTLLVGANAYPAADDRLFAQALWQHVASDIELLHATSALEFLSSIASARLLISGRFHHSIAAAVTETPFVVLDSNTPKIDGLMELLQVPSRVVEGAGNLAEQLREKSAQAIDEPDRFVLSKKRIGELENLAKSNFDFS